jgi:hypothetical protein
MPIGSIITQPSTDGIVAAYRPIVFLVSATATDSGPVPPVVYCDIYFDGVFYKTISKSQYKELDSGASNWEFDIQDAAQEYLGKFLGANGGEAIVVATPLVTLTTCKFRSSGLDTEGFIQQEGTPPVQGTGDTNPVDGTGTESGEFFIVNATLQHEDNPDLATHLASYENGTWDNGTFPLTHRPNHYKLCAVDSDYFPILSNKVPTKLRIHYVPKGGTDYTTGDSETVCIGVSFPEPSVPDAEVDVPYSYTLPLSGTAPFTILGSVKPGWMSIDVVGNDLVFSGTPTGGDVGTGIQVSVSLQNCSGDDTANFQKFISVTTCVGVSFDDFEFPDATANAPYNLSIPLSGTAPFALSVTTKPAWMNIAISGSTLMFTGTPAQSDIGTAISIQLSITNCGAADDADIDKTIDVLDSQNFIVSAAYNLSIDSITGTGVPAVGSTGVNGIKTGHHTSMSGSYSVVITGTPVLPTTKIDVYKNGGLISTTPIPAAGTYSVSITAVEADTISFFINS